MTYESGEITPLNHELLSFDFNFRDLSIEELERRLDHAIASSKMFENGCFVRSCTNHSCAEVSCAIHNCDGVCPPECEGN